MGQPEPTPEHEVADASDAVLDGVARAARDAAAGAGVAPDVAAELARAVLRRLPPGAGSIDPGAAGAQLADVAAFVAARPRGEVTFRSLPAGSAAVDGRFTAGTVLELACDDANFVVTSVEEELRRLGQRPLRLVQAAFGTERDAAGRLVSVGPARPAERRDAWLQVEFDGAITRAELARVQDGLHRVLSAVLSVTGDYPRMRDLLREAGRRIRAGAAPGGSSREVEETAALVDWIVEGNVVVLGTCVFPAVEGRLGPPDPVYSLGLLRDPASPLCETPTGPSDRLLDVQRTGVVSPVHRQVPMHRFDLAVHDAAGDLVAVGRMVCVFAHRAEGSPVAEIPLLRWKLQRVLELVDAVPGSYDELTVASLFQALPKDDLFHEDVAGLHRLLAPLLAADRAHPVRVQARPDPASHSVSVLVSVPAESYTPALRERVERFLVAQLDGDRIDTDVSLGDRATTVARFLVHVRDDAALPRDTLDGVANDVRQLCRTWRERLAEALEGLVGERADRMAGHWAARLPAAYRDAVDPAVAARDVVDLVALAEEADRRVAGGAPLRVRFEPDGDGGAEGATGVRLRAFGHRAPLELSRLVPMLESLGLWVVDEQHWAAGDGQVHELTLRLARPVAVDDTLTARLADALTAQWEGSAETDSLNRLVVVAALDWSQVVVLRAYRRYRRQVDPRYPAGYVNEVLVGHPDVARCLVRLFESLFPDATDVPPRVDDAGAAPGERTGEVEAAEAALWAACDAVQRLDHDRILRGLAGTVLATVRTNRTRGKQGPLALKLDSGRVPGMPVPVPHREIFVTGPAFEGVHLRAGPVARGGLRFSDRPADFRSEVLDLMRTQVLKNALIVPTGAKGGFVLRREPADHGPEVVRDAYEAFVSGLLDCTDDLRDGRVVPVAGRRDGDDAYLVVAADKGTAGFSDLANGIAEARGFWLGDAFASGGSHGYDHKAMGITARGAWVAVTHHFRQLGHDIQATPFTVAGVGDMSGDVFGNGMLQSRQIRLVAAFDHRDIFLDPDPDPDRTYDERRRLFEQPGSSWQDFDRSVLSAGGGVYSRVDKRVELSPEARAALRVDAEALTPPELVQAILRAPVDLLYLGGIGTYVRAGDEDDLAIDDRANAEVRVTAGSLRARVVGEGANLGFTQPARIEYARRGGRLNMDAIDNAAGVATSDHEVNLKILLALAVESGRIDRAERDRLLRSVTDDVAAAVLTDVGEQCAAITRAHRAATADIAPYAALVRELDAGGVIDRAVESLPDDDELDARLGRGAGLTRPELAVLLAGAKRGVRRALDAGGLVDDPAVRPALVRYFPSTLASGFDDLLDHHPLRREMVAAMLASAVVDRLGPADPWRLAGETGAGLADVVASYWYAAEVVDLDRIWRRMAERRGTPASGIDEWLDPGDVLAGLLDRMIRRHLAQPEGESVGEQVERDRPVVIELQAALLTLGRPDQLRARRRTAALLEAGGLAPDDAEELAVVAELDLAPETARLSRDTGAPPVEVAAAMLAAGDRLGIDRVRARVLAVVPTDPWATRARQGLLDDLAGLRREATARALRLWPSGGDEAVARLLGERADRVEGVTGLLRRLDAEHPGGLDPLAVATRAIRRAVL